MGSTRESSIEKHLCDKAKLANGEVRKVKWIGRNHAPDRLVLLPGSHFYIELKRPGKEPTAAQAREHARMRKSGMRIEWANTKEGIDRLFLLRG